MKKLMKRLSVGAVVLALTGAVGARADILVTTDTDLINGFLAGTTLQNFDSLDALPLANYNGQPLPGPFQFSHDSGQLPYFNSGGATPSDPETNPGTPIGIFRPVGSISADVHSGENVAGPAVVGTDPLIALEDNGTLGFMEIIFPGGVSKVGFFVTSGAVQLFLRDVEGNTLAGDASATATAGQFVGISRGDSDVVVAALVASGQDPFTIDDLVWAGQDGGGNEVPEAASVWTLLMAASFLGILSRKRIKS